MYLASLVDERMRGNQSAVGTVDHVHKTVLVGVEQHFARLALGLDVGHYVFSVRQSRKESFGRN